MIKANEDETWKKELVGAIKTFTKKELKLQLKSARKNKNQSDIKILEAELKNRKP